MHPNLEIMKFVYPLQRETYWHIGWWWWPEVPAWCYRRVRTKPSLHLSHTNTTPSLIHHHACGAGNWPTQIQATKSQYVCHKERMVWGSVLCRVKYVIICWGLSSCKKMRRKYCYIYLYVLNVLFLAFKAYRTENLVDFMCQSSSALQNQHLKTESYLHNRLL